MAANTGFAGFTGHKQAGGNFCAIEGLTSYSIDTNNRGFIGNYNLVSILVNGNERPLH